MKSYKIRTTMDMYNAVTSKNIDGFLKDFEVWLRGSIAVKETLASEQLKAGDNGFTMEMADAEFTWNEDGENGVVKGVDITIKNK